MGLVARQLEEAGIPTVILGCARDIVEHCGVPRFVFSDFPLGNPYGKPDDPESQRAILSLASDLLENAAEPRTTVQSPFVWSADDAWKADYSNPQRLSANEIAERRGDFDPYKSGLGSH